VVIGTGASSASEEEIWRMLDRVRDPEIPVVSIVELGMVRQVNRQGNRVTITLAPTFAGCPALLVIQGDIQHSLQEAGEREVEILLTYSPPWSSDDITPQARQKLKAFGLAPPLVHQGLIQLALSRPIECPYCNSINTTMKNSFGSTLCRAIYFCYNCHQPFEQFKPL
jgi:ring-1,2-phenylacetyl-CoA epoxidase subunit PaaD